MKTLLISIILLISISLKAQIAPFTDHDWTIEQIVTSDNTVFIADQQYSMFITYDDFLNQGYFFNFVWCEGLFEFNDLGQSFNILQLGYAISPDPIPIIDEFVYNFILQEGGETQTPDGFVYGPFSYDFTYSGGLVYLHITNLAGSVATFYANNLSQQDFLKESITIYPNPAKDVLHLESSAIAIDNIKFYDLSGRLVIEKENIDHQINVSQLQQGVYILEIETAVGVLREKLIKVD